MRTWTLRDCPRRRETTGFLSASLTHRAGRPRAVARVIAVLVVAGWGANPAASADQVWLLRNGKELTKQGSILDYSRDMLTLRLASGREESLDASQIIRIETELTAAHKQGDSAWEKNDFSASLASYLQALGSEKRNWVQRQILARIVRCYQYQGQIKSAVQHFLILNRNDPSGQFLNALPIPWDQSRLPAGLVETARTWMNDDSSPVSQLIGASWLLVEDRGSALSTLQRLTQLEDARLALLAESQRWRTQLATVDANRWTQHQNRVQRLPFDLRPGPYYVLAKGWDAVDNPDRAALAWLRVAWQYPHEKSLIPESLWHAGDALQRAGRNQEARALYQELLQQHPDSGAAARARQRLESSGR